MRDRVRWGWPARREQARQDGRQGLQGAEVAEAGGPRIPRRLGGSSDGGARGGGLCGPEDSGIVSAAGEEAVEVAAASPAPSECSPPLLLRAQLAASALKGFWVDSTRANFLSTFLGISPAGARASAPFLVPPSRTPGVVPRSRLCPGCTPKVARGSDWKDLGVLGLSPTPQSAASRPHRSLEKPLSGRGGTVAVERGRLPGASRWLGVRQGGGWPGRAPWAGPCVSPPRGQRRAATTCRPALESRSALGERRPRPTLTALPPPPGRSGPAGLAPCGLRAGAR